MAEIVPEADAQALQHFLSHSPWEARPVLDQVARDTDALLGHEGESCLILDDTGIAKKGDKSVGVSRQWLGRQGKTENCQVGVFAALCRGDSVGLLDVELYLPQEWVADPDRCRAVGVPEERQILKTKPQLGLEMIQRARLNGVRFSWVGADAGYGQDRALLRALDDAGETFVMDVHRDQRIYLELPLAPPSRGARRADEMCPVRVDEWVAQQPEEAWETVWIRRSTQGDLRVQALRQRVWVWERGQDRERCWDLIVTREMESPHLLKYSFSNAPVSTSTQRLAQMQRQLYWVERAFQDAKQEAGLAEYQARSWQAWYHHMALVLMAMLFLLRERLLHRETLPLLTAADVKILLAQTLPRNDLDIHELLRQMEARHRQRQAAMDSASRKRRRRFSDRRVNLTK